MKRTLILFATVLTMACEPAKLSEAELKEIVHQQNEKIQTAFMTADIEQLVLMYSPDAKLSGNGEKQIYRGRDAIKKFWTDAMKGAQLVDMETNTMTVDASGDIIYETGLVTTKVRIEDSVYVETGKYVNVWKKQSDGTYLLDVDTWNEVH